MGIFPSALSGSERGKGAELKLAFVIQKIAARSGGAERVLIETANEMHRRGHEVEILSHENRGVKPFYPLADGVTHRNLFNRPVKHKHKERWKRREQFREGLSHKFPARILKWHMTHGGFVRELRKYIKSEQPDVLIPFLPSAITPCALAARRIGVPVIASTHNEPSQDYTNKERWDRNPIDLRLRRKVWDDIEKMLVLLPAYKNWYPERLHHKIEDMPNPVLPVPPERPSRSVREKLIIGVGRLAAVKRLDLLIDAWATLRRRFPDWRVEIYGDGPLKENLQSLIKEHDLQGVVALKGAVSNIQEVYLRASVLCHPAQYEGFPLAVSEALAHGLPVIGFDDCSGLNSLVQHDKTGILVRPGTHRIIALENALAATLSAPEQIQRMSAAAPQSMAIYDPRHVYDKWEGLLLQYAKPELDYY